jgi:DNA-binding SARP family transcriptional activator
LGGVAEKTRIRLCGRFTAEVEGRRLDDALSGRQRLLLFAYLAASGGRPVPRDELIDALWPERLPKDPGAAFSVLLSKLRRGVGGELVRGSAELQLVLPPGGRVDVAVAEQGVATARSAIERGDWAAARKHAGAALDALDGEFLAGFDAPWIEARRRELEERRVQALDCVAQACLALGGGALVAAEQAGRELVERSPYRESGYRVLMEALAARGDVAEALLVFERLRVLLRDELGVPPSPALQELHARLLEGKHPATSAGRPRDTAWIRELALPRALDRLASSPFVGRRVELERLAGSWERALSGESVVALVTGEPGIGKTRLLAEFAGVLRAQSASVLYGAMEQHARLSPYEPIADALRGLAREAPAEAFTAARERGGTALRQLIPELFEGAPEAGEQAVEEPSFERQRLFQAIDAVLHEVAGAAPALLALDDLHWAERPALALLTHLARASGDVPLLIMATYPHTDLAADHPLSEALADLQRLGRVEAIPLSGLPEDEITELVSAFTESDDPRELASGLHAATDGNPLFVTEALRYLAEGTPLEALGTGHGRVAQGLEQVIAGRLSRLGEASRRALSLASVMGREFELAVVERAAGVEGDELLDAVEEAVGAGLLVETAGRPGQFSFSHTLVRDYLYASLSGARRARLHGRIGAELERFHRDELEPHLADLAQHFRESARLGVDAEKVLRYALAAGRRAADLFAWEEAEAHFHAVLGDLEDLKPRLPEPDRRRYAREAREGLGDAFGTSGRYEEAVESYHAALADAIDDHLGRARLHRKAGMALVRLHRYRQAHDAFDVAEHALEATPASARDSAWRREQAQVLLDRIPLLYWEDRVSDMEAVIERARPLVERVGTPEQRARLLESRCQLGLRRERCAPSDETMWLIEAALAASEEAGWSHGALWAKEGLGFCRLWRGDLDGARRALGDALAAAERDGNAAVHVRSLAYLTVVARRRGDVEATRRLAEETSPVAASSNAETYVASSKANLAWVAWRGGDLREARALAREALAIWDRLPGEYMFRWLAVWPLVAADLALAADEREALREAAGLLEHGQQALAEPLELLITEAVSAHGEGRTDDARDLLREALEAAEGLALA